MRTDVICALSLFFLRVAALTTDAAGLVRSPWEPGKSACFSEPGAEPASVFPERAPLLWADYLIPAVYGRRVCEIGEREGDIILCLAPHVVKAFVVEMEETSCHKFAQHNTANRVELICRRVTKENGKEILPDADVYIWWMEPNYNMELIDLVHNVARQRNRTVTVFFGFDGSSNLDDMPRVAPVLTRLKSREFGHTGSITRLFFDESHGEGLHGDPPPKKADPKGIVADGQHGRKPWLASYKHPYYGRYGHFGIFHVVSAVLGSQPRHRWHALHGRNGTHGRRKRVMVRGHHP
jgi:hypothetical protein